MLTARGVLCRSWAVAGTDPPRCASHGGTKKSPGAPEGNQNATKHGYYSTRDLPHASPRTLEETIGNLGYLHRKLFEYIEDHFPNLEVQEIVSLFSLFGQNSNRIGRLLRDLRAISGETSDSLAGAIASALGSVGDEMGINLMGDE